LRMPSCPPQPLASLRASEYRGSVTGGTLHLQDEHIRLGTRLSSCQQGSFGCQSRLWKPQCSVHGFGLTSPAPGQGCMPSVIQALLLAKLREPTCCLLCCLTCSWANLKGAHFEGALLGSSDLIRVCEVRYCLPSGFACTLPTSPAHMQGACLWSQHCTCTCTWLCLQPGGAR
jgi:hypothetical protein